MGECGSDLQFHAHASRQLFDLAVGGHVEPLQQLLKSRIRPAWVERSQHFADRGYPPVAVVAGGVEDDTDVGHVRPLDGARIWVRHPQQKLDRGRLSGAVGADKSGDESFFDRQVEGPERESGVVLGDPLQVNHCRFLPPRRNQVGRAVSAHPSRLEQRRQRHPRDDPRPGEAGFRGSTRRPWVPRSCPCRER
ncbi:hypothetical protein SDC9_134040 [bioreactor metagenome]|uniref:Uncharacterized protein n=1 Tax=bioreactor metagenome TaxID=1076179 RepID=A0A645DCK0_9ZZZZ